MVPATITRLLGRLRNRERALCFCWVFARGLGFAFGLLVLCCLIDWVVDLWVETPLAVRFALLVGQIVCWLTVVVIALLPWLRRIPDDEMAMHVEERMPELGDRLIATVQLNRPGAKIAGMSQELIQAVADEAERRASAIVPSQIIGTERLGKAAGVLAPIGVLAVMVGVLVPQTSWALLNRMFLGEQEIPRSIALEAGETLWPSGEEGKLEITVHGTVSASTVGRVFIEPEQGPGVWLALEHDHDTDDGAIFVARVPPTDTPLQFRAWLADARLRKPGVVRYSPRPIVESLLAWVVLPVEKIGRQPSGEPYQELQSSGDILYRLPGSKARLEVTSQVELSEVRVKVEGNKPREEVVRLHGTEKQVTVTFPLESDDTGYAVSLRSAVGFAGKEPTRRGIRKLPVEPPTVALLPETFWREGDSGTPEEREVDGIPILFGERCRLDYRGIDRFGLSHAVLRYRVVKKSKDGGDEAVELEQFLPLPLGAGRNPKKPPSEKAKEEFSSWTANFTGALPDTEGGGRCDFSSTGIPDGKGGLLRLEEGDRIQFYVEMYGKADPEGKPGRSEVREKEVMKLPGYLGWLKRKDDLAERTRALEEQQRNARPGGGGN